MTSADQIIDDILVEWEVARLKGESLSVDDLCRQHPELREQVAEKLAVLQELSWVGDPFEVVASPDPTEFLSPAQGAKVAEQTTGGEQNEEEVTLGEFLQALSDSGLVDDDGMDEVTREVGRIVDPASAARDLAARLVEQKRLTEYQANVLLERGDSPLLLDRYIILDSIGAGGMGIVFKALQVTLDRVVAVKVLPQHFVDSPEKVERFHREMRAVASISHPNVVQAFDAHESNGIYFFAMEYVPGSDLATLVREQGPLGATQAAKICAQIASGLANAHKNGIVHRDVKPANVLLSEEGVAKVLDLGLARTRELAHNSTDHDLTRDGLTLGTVAYMAPEQAFDAKSATFRSDIYGLGCTLFYLLHGKPMFNHENPVQTVVAHREVPAPRLANSRNDVSTQLEQLFQQLVAKRPSDRPASMNEIRERFEQLTNSTKATSTVASVKPPVRMKAVDPQPQVSATVPSAASVPSPLPSQQVAGTVTTAHGTHSSSQIWKWLAGGLALALMLAIGLILGRDLLPARQSGSSIRPLVTQIVGSTSATVTALKEGDPYLIEYPEDLPDEPFSIVEATVYADEDPDFGALARLLDLHMLTIDGVTDQSEDSVFIAEFDGQGLDSLDKLDDLTISYCQLDAAAINEIAKLTSLRKLSLSGCVLPESLTALTQLSELEDLSLDDTNVSDKQVATIRAFSKLRYLDVSETSMTAAGVGEISKMGTLQELLLSSLEIDSVIDLLGEMKQMKHLNLSETDLTDESLDALHSLPALESVDLVGTSVTEKAVIRFEEACPNCDLYLEEEAFLDELP